MNIYQEVQEAEARIRKYVQITPLEPAPSLGAIASSDVYLKLENLNHTGSFKIRGAFNKLLSLSDEERQNGIVTTSSGNHSLATAFALKKLSVSGTIFLSEVVTPLKLAKLKEYDVRIEIIQDGTVEAEAAGRDFGVRNGLVYVSPYNDVKVIGGQGTVGLELFQQEEGLDCVFVAVGGGGLISGVAGFLKEANPNIMIVGCEPQNSQAMSTSVKAGHIVDVEFSPSLSDGTAGLIEHESLTLEPCVNFVDDWMTVTEAEIVDGLRWLYKHHGHVIEGAAGVVVAAYLKRAKELHRSRVALVICGGNIDEQKFKTLVN